MATRFTETPNIRQVNTSTGAAAGLSSLADRLNNFASQQAQVAQVNIQRKAQLAAVEGQAQFDPNAPLAEQQQDVPTFFGQEAKAFNQGLRAAYVAGVDNDNRLEVSRIAQENPDNLLVFNDAIGAYRESVLGGVDQSSRAIVAQSLDDQISSARIQVQGSTIKRQKREIEKSLSDNVSSASESSKRLAFNGDNLGAAKELQKALSSVDAMDLSEDDSAVLKRGIEKDVTEQVISGNIGRLFDNEGVGAAVDEIDRLSSEVPKGWTVDEWQKFVADENTEVNRKVKRQALVAKKAAKEDKIAAKTARGMLFLDPGVPADPAKGGDDREDINLAYDSVSRDWAGLSAQGQIDQNVDFVKNTGLVPDQMISNVNASMRSGTPEQAALMSDYMARIQEESPNSLSDIPAESRAIAMQVSDAVKAGIDPIDALELARKSTFALTDSEKNAIAFQSQEASKGLNDSLQSFVDKTPEQGGFDVGIFGGAFSRVPDVPASMLGEYRSSFDRFMKMTGGNVDQAQRLSYQAVQSTWGVTETGGSKRFMKYSPEVAYKMPGVDTNWVENQFNEEMENAGALGATLAVDHSTARESRPSYPVLITDEATGLQKPLLNESNEVVRWKPDFKETEQFSALTSEPGKQIESAKKQRKVNLTRRANEIRRSVQSRILSAQHIPFNERVSFMESEEGRRRIGFAIESMAGSGKIDEAEAKEAKKAFGVQ